MLVVSKGRQSRQSVHLVGSTCGTPLAPALDSVVLALYLCSSFCLVTGLPAIPKTGERTIDENAICKSFT